ncbi:MAG: T9SS type A sorting domain-containing protein, partial [Ignavibacteriaceae bacterium]
DKNNLSIYNRPDELSAFTLKDSVLQGIEIESGAWDPLVSSNLWLSAGNYAYNQPYGNFAGSEGTYYEFNTTTWQKVDSIKWQFNLPANPSERPRGIAFSKDGKTAYIAAFGSSDYSPVQKFTRSGVGVEKLGNTLPTAYLLDQNYPNPFNPETSIRFSIPSESFVTVKVFNTLGEEVTTLVNEQKTAGVYSVSFKANNITSGIYFYTINANNFTSTKKMILLR